MSLDVYLTQPDTSVGTARQAIFIRRDGARAEVSRDEWDRLRPGVEPVVMEIAATSEVYSANITHNLNKMAGAAGIYEALWRPEEIGITKASQLIEPLSKGLSLLLSDRAKFEQHNAANGWGMYDDFIQFVANYLAACAANPQAHVSVSR